MDLRSAWPYIELVAHSRLEHNITPRHDYRFGEKIELIGVAGELAARRFLGLSEELHTHFDGGKDMISGFRKIDVKATTLTPRLKYRFLQWPQGKPVRADYVLMTAIDVLTQSATVVGYATREEILSAPVNTSRPTPCHEIPVVKLHPAWELVVRKVHKRHARV